MGHSNNICSVIKTVTPCNYLFIRCHINMQSSKVISSSVGNLPFPQLHWQESIALRIIWVGVNVNKLWKYPLSPVPYSLGTANGYMTETDKSKGMQFLVKGVNDAPQPDDANTMFIQDSDALFHAMTDIQNNFKVISNRIFAQENPLHFSTDTYQNGSIKDMERDRHGSSEKLIIGGQLTKTPAD